MTIFCVRVRVECCCLSGILSMATSWVWDKLVHCARLSLLVLCVYLFICLYGCVRTRWDKCIRPTWIFHHLRRSACDLFWRGFDLYFHWRTTMRTHIHIEALVCMRTHTCIHGRVQKPVIGVIHCCSLTLILRSYLSERSVRSTYPSMGFVCAKYRMGTLDQTRSYEEFWCVTHRCCPHTVFDVFSTMGRLFPTVPRVGVSG